MICIDQFQCSDVYHMCGSMHQLNRHVINQCRSLRNPSNRLHCLCYEVGINSCSVIVIYTPNICVDIARVELRTVLWQAAACYLTWSSELLAPAATCDATVRMDEMLSCFPPWMLYFEFRARACRWPLQQQLLKRQTQGGQCLYSFNNAHLMQEFDLVNNMHAHV